MKKNIIYKQTGIFIFIVILFQHCGGCDNSKRSVDQNKVLKELSINLLAFKEKLVCADEKNDTLIGNSSESLTCEIFTLIYFDSAIVSLKSFSNKYIYVRKGNGDFLIAGKDSIESAERFVLIKLDSNYVAFRTIDGKYVCADQDFNGKIVANRPWIGDWEKFRIIEKRN